MTTWSERARLDASLAAWRDAEIARAGIDVQAAKVALEQEKAANRELRRKLARYEGGEKGKR